MQKKIATLGVRSGVVLNSLIAKAQPLKDSATGQRSDIGTRPQLEYPTGAARTWIIGAALVALFLGAVDALVMSAAMPTIVAELGGLAYYSWVYSAYFLSRAVFLPIFGKLADVYPSRPIFLSTIALFCGASLMAGLSPTMGLLVVWRTFQGVGAGGIFALSYICLADISPPHRRGKTMSLASAVWGLASVIGPTLGAAVVTYLNWRWIFYMNLPLGMLSIWGIGRFLREIRPKRGNARLDWAGLVCMTVCILALMVAFLLAGRSYSWLSWPVAGLLTVSILGAAAFYRAERRAPDPVLPLHRLMRRDFGLSNLSVFCSSFTIFSLFAYAPLFIQAGQGRNAMQVGMAMLSLSFGWSMGSLFLGRFVDRSGKRATALAGGALLVAGSGGTLLITAQTGILVQTILFLLVGVGMGFVTLSTLLVVQSSVPPADLGMATGTHQYARTLGGTVGVGICGGLVTGRIATMVARVAHGEIGDVGQGRLLQQIADNPEVLLKPNIGQMLPQTALASLREAVIDGVGSVFLIAGIAALACLLVVAALPGSRPAEHKQ
jgi:EmrB/QacA subfamily drug resistance transporter